MILHYRIMRLKLQPGFQWGPHEDWIGVAEPHGCGDGRWIWQMAAGDEGEEQNEESVLVKLLGICDKHNITAEIPTPNPWLVEDRTQLWFHEVQTPWRENFPRMCVDDPRPRKGARGKLHVWWNNQQHEGSPIEGQSLVEEVHDYIEQRALRRESYQ